MHRKDLCTCPETVWMCSSRTGRSPDKGGFETSLLLSLTLGRIAELRWQGWQRLGSVVVLLGLRTPGLEQL